MFLGAVGLALVMPIRNVDAAHHWGFAAKVFHYEGGVRNPVYLDVDRGYVYRRYPILVPVTLFSMYSAAGHIDDQAVKVVFPVFFGMLLLVLHGAMQRERPGAGALLVLVCVAACGSYFRYEGGAVSALADVPLSFFVVLGLIEWRRWAAGEAGSHPLRWALPLCGAAVTKTEGVVVLGTALLAAALLRRRARPIPWRRVVACLACVGLLVAPWYGFAWSLRGVAGYVPDQGSALGALPRNLPSLLWNARAFLLEMANGEDWGVLWLLLAVAVVLGWRGTSRAHRIVVGLMLIQVAVYQFSYLLTPADPQALVSTTKMRLLLHLAPIAAYLSWSFLPPLPKWLDPPRATM
jgi:hypothetical protein